MTNLGLARQWRAQQRGPPAASPSAPCAVGMLHRTKHKMCQRLLVREDRVRGSLVRNRVWLVWS